MEKKHIVTKEVMKKINEVVDRKSRYIKMKRKSKDVRIKDNIDWYEKYGFVNTSYNLYGLDVENFRNINDYLEKAEIRGKRLEIYQDDINPKKHKVLVNHKPYFFGFLNYWIPEYSFKVNLVFCENKIFYPVSKYQNTEEAINSFEDGSYLCTPVEESKYIKSFIFLKKESFFSINNEKVNPQNIISKTKMTRYLIQKMIDQSQEIEKFFSDELLIIRIDTECWNEKTSILGAYAKFRVNYKFFGIGIINAYSYVGIDDDKGVFKKYGEYLKNTRSTNNTKHPVSKKLYEGFEIPHWEKCKDLVKQLHFLFYGIPSIGWDIIITNKGPVVIDATYLPSIEIAQLANGGLKKRWNDITTSEKDSNSI